MIADWLHTKADFFTIQEAHITNNRAAYLRNQLSNCDVEIFWTAPTDTRETKSKAGVLLIVRKSFLGRIEFQGELRNVRTNCSHNGGLANSAQGHAIGLRLQSRLKGDLDIWAIYAPSDNAQHRRRLWTTIASNMKKSALNVMAGDFSFVECNGGRFNGATHEFTGHGDSVEAMEFTRLIFKPVDKVEIEQRMHTHIWGKPDNGGSLHLTHRQSVLQYTSGLVSRAGNLL